MFVMRVSFSLKVGDLLCLPFKLAVAKSGIVDSLLSWTNFKQNKDLKKIEGAKT